MPGRVQPTPIASVTPTPLFSLDPVVTEAFPFTTAWFEALDNSSSPDLTMAQLVRAFSTDAITYLESVIDPFVPLQDQSAALAQMAADLPGHARGSGQVVPVDLDKAAPAELFVVPKLNGGPLLYVHYVDGNWRSLPVPVVPPEASQAVDNAFGLWPATAEAHDVTGDGQPEALVTHTFSGGSNWREHLQVLRWNGAGFDVLFRAELVNWAGRSTWSLEPDPSGGQVVHLTYPVFLPGRHPKVGINPQGEQFWRWDEESSYYQLTWQTVAPPVVWPAELSLAEGAFVRGDYAAAIPLYEAFLGDEAWQQGFLKDRASALLGRRELEAWLDLARLRRGLGLALSGRAADARTALVGLETAGPLAELAQAFLGTYASAGDLLVGLAAYERRLAIGPNDELVGEFGRPAAVQYAFVPQPVLVQFALNQVGPDGLAATLEANAAPVTDLAVSDLDGDGAVEVIWLSPPSWHAYGPNKNPVGNWQQVWVAWQRSEPTEEQGSARWQVTGIAAADQIESLDIMPPDAQGRRGVQLYLIDAEQTRQLTLFWDGETGRPWAPTQPLDWPVLGW